MTLISNPLAIPQGARCSLLPIEQGSLDPVHHCGYAETEARQQREQSHHAVHVKSRLQIRERLPQPVLGCDEFGAANTPERQSFEVHVTHL